MEARVKKQIQIEQERDDADMIKAKYIEDKEVVKQQKVDTAKHFKEIWEAQAQLKQQTAAVENVF